MRGLTLGIDPGITGAMALLDAEGCAVMVEHLPTIARGNAAKVKREIDPAGLVHLLRIHAGGIEAAWLEQVSSRPGQGVASVFSLGHSVGSISATLATLGIPIHLVTPAAWKRQAGLTSSDKEQARALAVRLFPAIPLHRKADHNLAEALLIARHGWLARQ